MANNTDCGGFGFRATLSKRECVSTIFIEVVNIKKYER